MDAVGGGSVGLIDVDATDGVGEGGVGFGFSGFAAGRGRSLGEGLPSNRVVEDVDMGCSGAEPVSPFSEK